MSLRRPEPEPYEWPEGHAWTTTLTVALRWVDGKWQVAADPGLERDPEGALCTHGLHLDDPDARARCEAVRRQLDLEPTPATVGLARQLAALEGLVLAPERSTDAQA